MLLRKYPRHSQDQLRSFKKTSPDGRYRYAQNSVTRNRFATSWCQQPRVAATLGTCPNQSPTPKRVASTIRSTKRFQLK
ncbi:MAG: hypothetical protein ACI97B_004381 [Verrucomicrobiales bacterium]|jgi:hypothetical protein